MHMLLRSGILKGTMELAEVGNEPGAQDKELGLIVEGDSGVGKSVADSVGIDEAVHSTPVIERSKREQADNRILQMLQKMGSDITKMGNSMNTMETNNSEIIKRISGVEGKLVSIQEENGRLMTRMKHELETKIEDKVTPVVSTLSAVKQRVDQNVEDITGLSYKLDIQSAQTDAKLEIADKRLGKMEETVVKLDREVKEVVEEIVNIGNRTYGGISGSNVVRMIDVDKPRFADDSKAMHPVDFIRKLEEYLDTMQIRGRKQVTAAVSCLASSAHIWADSQSEEWGSFSEFKIKFLEKYWSQVVQEKILEDLRRTDQYNPANGSYADHVGYWKKQTKYLEPKLSEGSLTRSLIKHLPISLRELVIASGAETTERVVKVVTELQNNHGGNNEGRSRNQVVRDNYSNNQGRYNGDNRRQGFNNSQGRGRGGGFSFRGNSYGEHRDSERSRDRGAYSTMANQGSVRPRTRSPLGGYNADQEN